MYQCLFCKCVFDSLPFYACCSRCYSTSATVRLLVDVSTPQTDSSIEWVRARTEAEVA